MAAVGVTSFASQLVLWIRPLGMATKMIAPKVSLHLAADQFTLAPAAAPWPGGSADDTCAFQESAVKTLGRLA